MSVFTPRKSYKPFEYPEAINYANAISHSYWLVSEWNFLADVDDFRVRLTPAERSAVKNALLAISQIEVAVKKFWGRLGDRFPKAEFEAVGAVFADSEHRHASSYSHLLEVLGLNSDFEALLEVPAIQGRVDYLSEAIAGAKASKDEDFSLTLALFSLFVENVSLFSQFLVVRSVHQHRGVLKDVDNVIQATMKEEAVHALFGVYLLNLIRGERPDWFGPAFAGRVAAACEKAFRFEAAIVDWIFEAGELPYLTPATVKAFLRARFNESLELIGLPAPFDVDQSALAPARWFSEELLGEASTDFFFKRPTAYSKRAKPVTAEDLF